MYVVQKRDTERSHWKTCSINGRKCRYEYIAEARTAFRRLKNMSDGAKAETRQFRIIDTEDGDREVD